MSPDPYIIYLYGLAPDYAKLLNFQTAWLESEDYKDKQNINTIAPLIIKHTMLKNKTVQV